MFRIKQRYFQDIIPVSLLSFFLFTSMELRVGLISHRNITSSTIKPVDGNIIEIDGKKTKSAIKVSSYQKNKLKISFDNTLWIKNNKVVIKGEGILRLITLKKERDYKGVIEIENINGYLVFVNKINLEDYVLSVCNSETRNMNNIEAIKANAIAIRTYAISAMKRHLKDGYNLCDLTHCQLYEGFKNIRSVVYKAVKETQGIIMEYDGKPIWAMYHSVCGGETEDPYELWGDKTMPYLKSVKDRIGGVILCSDGWGYRWRTKISREKFEKFAKDVIIKNKNEKFVDLILLSYTYSKRVKDIAIITDKRKITISSIDFYHLIGRKLGWMAIKSTYFNITKNGKYIVFEGRGYGHGVGMCQAGAEKMGEMGYKYDEILMHYYKGIKFSRI